MEGWHGHVADSRYNIVQRQAVIRRVREGMKTEAYQASGYTVPDTGIAFGFTGVFVGTFDAVSLEK